VSDALACSKTHNETHKMPDSKKYYIINTTKMANCIRNKLIHTYRKR